MKTAKDFPITFPYGSRDGVYYAIKDRRNSAPPYGDGKVSKINGSVGAYHRGDDRAMPTGTQVKVNNTVIGLSGATGAASGPHLHIGRFRLNVAINPEGNGFKLRSKAKVTRTGKDDISGNFVYVKNPMGDLWFYCHLSKIKVKVGDIVK